MTDKKFERDLGKGIFDTTQSLQEAALSDQESMKRMEGIYGSNKERGDHQIQLFREEIQMLKHNITELEEKNQILMLCLNRHEYGEVD